jgi:hypothetical protein
MVTKGIPIFGDDAVSWWIPTHRALIRVYNDAGNVIETHEHNGDFKEG